LAAGLLAIGPSADTVTGNRIRLDSGSYTLSAVQLHIGTQMLNGMEIADYVRDAVQRGNQPVAPNRELTIGLKVGGATEAAIASNLRALQNVLKQARDGAKLSPLGPPVVVVWQPDGAAPETYMDVVGGHISELYRAGVRTSGAGQPVKLILTVRPFFRQKQTASGNPTVTIATSATTTDCAATYYIADTGADADSPLRLTITDQSSTSKIINRLTIARRSLSPLAATDFSPILTPVAASPGTSFADATARGGATPRLAATSSAWQTLAKVTQPGTGLAQGGEVRIRVRARDSSPYIDPTDTATAPTVTPSTASGTLPPDTYLVRLATVDANGVESAAGYPQTATLPQAASGLYDTFSSGGLANWDNSGYQQFYRTGTTQAAGSGSISAIPDAAYEGVYGARALVTSTVAQAASTADVYRCVLQKGAQGVATGASGTSTVYGRFRVNEIITPDGVMQPFITFFSAAQGNTSGVVSGYATDYAVFNTSGTSSGVLAGLRFIAGDIWQFCAPYGPGGAWAPLPGYYVHITNGNWYNFACSLTATFVSAGSYKITLNSFTLNGVLITGAQAQTGTGSGFPTTGAALTPSIGAELFSPSAAGAPFYDLNDILSVDFDDIGCETVTTLGNLAISWSAISGASSYNVYYAPIENPTVWGRVVLGNVTSTTLSTPVTTAATLPQSRLSGTIAPALIRVLIYPPNAAAVGPTPTAGGQPLLCRSNWEFVDTGVATLAAIPPQDAGVSPLPWVFLIQAQAAGANSSTVDVDTALELDAMEDQLVIEVVGANLPSLGAWVADSSRFDRQTCIISPVSGGSATAYPSITGQMHCGQGSTQLLVMAEISDGAGHFITDLQHTAFSVGAVVSPVMETI